MFWYKRSRHVELDGCKWYGACLMASKNMLSSSKYLLSYKRNRVVNIMDSWAWYDSCKHPFQFNIFGWLSRFSTIKKCTSNRKLIVMREIQQSISRTRGLEILDLMINVSGDIICPLRVFLRILILVCSCVLIIY